MNWDNNEEFEDVFGEVRKELYKTDFFTMMMIDNVEKFLEFLREHLVTAQDHDLLSDILKLALDDYQKWETYIHLETLSEQGLIRMVVDENGRLAYEATEEGLAVSDELMKAIGGATKLPTYQEVEQTNEIMDIKYSADIFKVTGVDDSIRFVDHMDSYEYMVIPAGKQHNGERMVQYYHTIFMDYEMGDPNGEYKLVDEYELYDMLNEK